MIHLVPIMFAPTSKQSRVRSHLTFRARSVARCEKAFTLVEVTIALGIISFSLLSILGLMPVGFASLKSSMDQTVETQIAQNITGLALLTPYDSLESSLADQTFYYDDAGRLLTSTPAIPPDKTRYWVTVQLTDPVYPGSSNATSAGASLKTVKIWIVNAPSASAAKKKVSKYVIQVPNCGN